MAKTAKIDDKKILREISELFGVVEKELPKTLQRFKDEIEKMEKELKDN